MISKLHYIASGNSPKEHLENIQHACQSGAELVQLSLKGLSEKKQLKLAQEARDITAHFQTRLIFKGSHKIAQQIKADGVLIENSENSILEARNNLNSWQIIGGTANTLEDCKSLLKNNIDYIQLGPFHKTHIKENTTTPLGINGYLTILDVLKTKTPIIAFGGIEVTNILDIMMTKVDGIAMSTAITQNFNLIPKINTFLDGPVTKEQVWKMQ
jgi:thiamine-phosphate pyrophosphorylase